MTTRFRRTLRRGAASWPITTQRRFPTRQTNGCESWCDGDSYRLADVADVGGQVLAETKAGAFDVFMDFDFVRFMLSLDPVLLSHGDEYRGGSTARR